MTQLQPSPQHRFTFGLPRSAPRRHGPGGEPSPLPVEPWDFVHGLADIGAWGIAADDDELVPPTATSQERESILGKLRAALDNTGMTVSAVTTDLSGHPAFAGGAFTSADVGVRRCAIQKTLRALELGAELGAPIHILRTSNEGATAAATGMPADTLERYREAIDFLCGYVRDQELALTLAIEPGGPEAGGETLFPTVGHTLAFVETLEHPDLVGLSPRMDSMAGHGAYRGVAHAIWSGRLSHLDLSAAPAGFDHGFGSSGLKDAFFLVKILEEQAYAGPRHFGTGTPVGEVTPGIWEYAAGCMHTYLALAGKVRRFADDPDIQEALADAGGLDLAEPAVGRYNRDDAQELADGPFDPDALAEDGYHHARLDQLVTDLVLGLR